MPTRIVSQNICSLKQCFDEHETLFVCNVVVFVVDVYQMHISCSHKTKWNIIYPVARCVWLLNHKMFCSFSPKYRKTFDNICMAWQMYGKIMIIGMTVWQHFSIKNACKRSISCELWCSSPSIESILLKLITTQTFNSNHFERWKNPSPTIVALELVIYL